MKLSDLDANDASNARQLIQALAAVIRSAPGQRIEITADALAAVPASQTLPLIIRQGDVDKATVVLELGDRERTPEAEQVFAEMSEYPWLPEDPTSTGQVLDQVVYLVEGSGRGGGDRTDSEVVDAIWEVVHDKATSDLDGSPINWGEIGELAMRCTSLEEQLEEARRIIESFFRPAAGPADDLDPRWQATGYDLDVFAGTVNAGVWNLKVEARGAGRWAVTRFGQCLGTDGEWDYERQPSSRTDDWKRTHRFDLLTALRLAQQHYDTLVVNGQTPAQALAEHEARARQEARHA